MLHERPGVRIAAISGGLYALAALAEIAEGPAAPAPVSPKSAEALKSGDMRACAVELRPEVQTAYDRIKELEQVQGWPDTGASLVFRDQVASFTSETTRRFIQDGGANPVGLTTASEFGGLNVSVTKLNGVCHNPWRYGRTVGGSSGGSASAVAGGLVSMALVRGPDAASAAHT